MLLSVLQDQPGAAGKALIPHSAGLSTKPRVHPGKGVNSQGGFQVAGALRSIQKHAGNEGMGAAPLQPTLSAPSPPSLRSPGCCPGAGRSGAPEVGQCAGRGAGTARGWVLKNPDTAGLEARARCPALTLLSPRQTGINRAGALQCPGHCQVQRDCSSPRV